MIEISKGHLSENRTCIYKTDIMDGQVIKHQVSIFLGKCEPLAEVKDIQSSMRLSTQETFHMWFMWFWFNNISILENHLGIIHGQEWSCSLVAGLYACGICDFEFKNVSILEDHLEIGHIQKEALCLYSCEICDFEFRNMWNL